MLELETCTCSFDYPEGIRWNDAELDIIVKEILDAWNNDISLLSEREKENFEVSELFARLFDKYKSVDNILSQVIISNNLDPTKHNELLNLLIEFSKYHLPCVQLKLLVNQELDALNNMYDIVCGSNVKEIVAACDAIYTTVSMQKAEHQQVITELLKKLSLNIRIRRKQGLTSVIHLFHNLIYSDLLPICDEIIDNLLFGLEHLIFETELSNDILGCTTNQCLQLRSAAMSLAYILYEKNQDKPEIIDHLLNWQSLKDDLNEYSEIRNKWLEI